MPKVKQVTVCCENRPGTLARIAGVLPAAKVNILALLATTAGAEGFVRIVVDKPEKAKKAPDGAGLRYAEQEILQVELPNVPGALRKFAGKPAAQDINITAIRQPRRWWPEQETLSGLGADWGCSVRPTSERAEDQEQPS